MGIGDETIAAMATAPGEAGVGVVRVSGTAALAAADQFFRVRRGGRPSVRRSHSITYGWVVNGAGELVDEALLLIMKGPRSYTGEDVVEVHCHGGQVVVRQVLEAILGYGVRLAEPGEFTRRAFLNGRLDLGQAEAVIDIIRAKTDRALTAAVRQLGGGLGEAVRPIRDRLLEMMAHLEADIDFPELDLEVATLDAVAEGCQWCLGEVERLLRGARQGRLLREGFRVVLAGRPNVGKSSLLNRLVRENRAIVTNVPGTTRDVIEEWISIRGLPVQLADTAGIRETRDEVERLGVERSRAMLERADLVILVLDASVGYTKGDAEIAALVPRGTRIMLAWNKIDLPSRPQPPDGFGAVGMDVAIGVSAETGEGLEALEGAIASAAGLFDHEESAVANVRQEEAARRAAEHLRSALETRAGGFGSDMVAIDLRAAWTVLGELTGDTVGEDLLDQIFSRFCIGK